MPALPPGWRRAWVLRYPGTDPAATVEVLEQHALRGQREFLDFGPEGQAEIIEFRRRAGE